MNKNDSTATDNICVILNLKVSIYVTTCTIVRIIPADYGLGIKFKFQKVITRHFVDKNSHWFVDLVML